MNSESDVRRPSRVRRSNPGRRPPLDAWAGHRALELVGLASVHPQGLRSERIVGRQAESRMRAAGLCQCTHGRFSSFMLSAPLTWLSNGP